MRLLLIIIVLFFQILNNTSAQNVLFDVYGLNNDEKAYLGVDNRLKVVVEGKMCNEFILKTDNGNIYQKSTEDCVSIFNPKELGQSKIHICTIENNDTLIFKTIKIDVVPLPLVFNLGPNFVTCKCQKSISKSEFLRYPFAMYALNTNLTATLPISGFEISIIRDSKEIFNQHINKYNREIDENIKSDLQILRSGDIVKLDQIMYKYFDGLDVISDSVELLIQ